MSEAIWKSSWLQTPPMSEHQIFGVLGFFSGLLEVNALRDLPQTDRVREYVSN